jgi:hypothetical protein
MFRVPGDSIDACVRLCESPAVHVHDLLNRHINTSILISATLAPYITAYRARKLPEIGLIGSRNRKDLHFVWLIGINNGNGCRHPHAVHVTHSSSFLKIIFKDLRG